MTNRVNKEPFGVPEDPRGKGQKTDRQKTVDAIEAWHLLSYAEKEAWLRKGKERGFSGFHLFLQDYLLTH